MKKNKKQLHEALVVLLTKLSSARDNPLLMDNYAVKALRTVLLDFKESGELHEAYKEQIQSTLESDNPWVAMMMKSIGADPSIKKSMRERHRPRLTIREGSKGTHGSQWVRGIRCQARLPLHEAASNQGKRADEERRRNEPPLDGRRNPACDKQRDNLKGHDPRGYSLFGKYGLCGLLSEGNQDRERLCTVCYCRSQ